MKRTRAIALALVNWKGVFYERYLLDANVTALEGANGSGKTTVLIAAYVVLLPDMTKLRFTNIGEHTGGSGDRGLWGRLGRPGRPSYSVLDLRLPDGARLLAGVHLERRGEPVVEPTPFVVTELPDSIALQDLLLERGDVDAVPELPQLKEQVARVGARLHQCESAKEYFAMLFERGVTPMRLATENERTKLNDMLRTSMTGGISRALTNELRGFLLKEETGLADALKRMRASLDACRRTRTEVDESRRLETEISAVYEAGQSMFAAAVHATKERAQELLGRVRAAREALKAAEADESSAKEKCEAAKSALETLRREQEEVIARLNTNREQLGKLQAALRVQNRIHGRLADLETANGTLELETQCLATLDGLALLHESELLRL